MNIGLENKYKILLLQTFKEFIKLCEEYDLKYVAAYGTVLGAVRHKGLIPWDDDIDVYMPRKDYERFLSLKNIVKNTQYQIYDINDEGYYLPYAKYCNKKTSLWEIEELPCIIGVFIDVFPLDELSLNSKIEANRIFELYKKRWSQYYCTIIKPSNIQIINNIYKLNIRYLACCIRNALYRCFFKQKIKKKLLDVENEIKLKQGDLYVYYDIITPGVKIEKSIYPKRMIDNIIKVEFEDIMINIPEDYHNYLTGEYGDYMKFPPKEKQISNHSHFFLDLERRLNIKDIQIR